MKVIVPFPLPDTLLLSGVPGPVSVSQAALLETFQVVVFSELTTAAEPLFDGALPDNVIGVAGLKVTLATPDDWFTGNTTDGNEPPVTVMFPTRAVPILAVTL